METVVGQCVKDDCELVDVGIKAKYYIFSMYRNIVPGNFESQMNDEAKTSDKVKNGGSNSRTKAKWQLRREPDRTTMLH